MTVEPLNQVGQLGVVKVGRVEVTSGRGIRKIKFPETLRQLADRVTEIPEAIRNECISPIEVALHLFWARMERVGRVLTSPQAGRSVRFVNVVRCPGPVGLLLIEFSALVILAHCQFSADAHNVRYEKLSRQAIHLPLRPEADDPVPDDCAPSDLRFAQTQGADAAVHVRSHTSVCCHDVAEELVLHVNSHEQFAQPDAGLRDTVRVEHELLPLANRVDVYPRSPAPPAGLVGMVAERRKTA